MSSSFWGVAMTELLGSATGGVLALWVLGLLVGLLLAVAVR